MTLRQILELLTLISAHGPNLVESSFEPPAGALARYWNHSKAQSRRWKTQLDACRILLEHPASADHYLIEIQVEPVLTDILAGELIARVWGALLAAWNERAHAGLSASISSNVLASTLESRRSLLRLLVDRPGELDHPLARLDRLRRRLERWTDLLIGHLVYRYRTDEYAHDLERALDFGREQIDLLPDPMEPSVWDLYLLCLRTSFPATPLVGGPSGEARDEVIQSILACIPSTAFMTEGPLSSVWLHRLLEVDRAEGPPKPASALSAKGHSNSRIRSN
jgi:hypothetical protein